MSKLEKIIEEQEEKIEALEERIEWFERVGNTMVHRFIDEVKINKTYPGYVDLPLPRFEMQINPLDKEWYNIEWVYGIVYKQICDDSIVFVPFSRTTGSGGNYKKMKEIEFPFRDGLHIRVEMKLFNLPGYVLFRGKIEEIDNGDYTSEHISKMYEKIQRDSKLNL